jgi:polysaccharide biosynthesis/export protein
MLRAALLAVALGMAAGHISGQSGSATPGSGTVLRPGDAVRVAVWQRQDLSGEFAVTSDGRVAHPILKDVVVAGVGFDEALRRIDGLLREFHGDARFVVEPLIRVGVGGEVRQPNLYHVPVDMTVAYAVSRAGGPTDRGRFDRVVLMRDGASHILDLTDPAAELVNAPLRSGDQILVGRRRDVLREYVMPLSSIVGAIAALVRVTR